MDQVKAQIETERQLHREAEIREALHQLIRILARHLVRKIKAREQSAGADARTGMTPFADLHNHFPRHGLCHDHPQ